MNIDPAAKSYTSRAVSNSAKAGTKWFIPEEIGPGASPVAEPSRKPEAARAGAAVVPPAAPVVRRSVAAPSDQTWIAFVIRDVYRGKEPAPGEAAKLVGAPKPFA